MKKQTEKLLEIIHQVKTLDERDFKVFKKYFINALC